MRITSKGQITIPKAIRDKLGLPPGTEVEFWIERGAVHMGRATGKHPRRRIVRQPKRHHAKITMTTEEIMQHLRIEPRDDECA